MGTGSTAITWRPGSFVTRPSSLSHKYWPPDLRFDPNFSTVHDLEWLVEDPDDIVVVGLLMREFGRSADPSIYGDAAPRVTHRQVNDMIGPEYAWAQLRAEEFSELVFS